jgi:hypothetical protein
MVQPRTGRQLPWRAPGCGGLIVAVANAHVRIELCTLVFHQGYFDGVLVGWGEFANPNKTTAQFVGVTDRRPS